jgi:beta-N-acetylhexosaminidase
MNKERILSSLFVLGVLLSAVGIFPSRATGPGQSALPESPAQELLSTLTPEQRIGQLFLVTFTGTDASQKSQIYDLVANHDVGGVVLLASNDNFVDAPNTLTSTYQLITQLQGAELQAQQATLAPGTSTPPAAAPYIPLFVGISQDGDGATRDQILNGLTPLPDPMAIGATWDPTLARQVGTVAGQELSALGFNLYFGPPLDVLDSPADTPLNGLATNVFGGDPYWVGAMGQAFISGVHAGSNERMAVIAKHFPGEGSSDRPEGAEAATVRKSLDQLKQIELAPFFAVTGNAPDPTSVADGLLVSHIRYQGLQGNIRSTTRPVSFDPQALSFILSLPQFTSWRASGGVMISDDLGSQTVRLFYTTGGQPFQANQVALDAFQAGNDLLYLGGIQSSDAPDNYTSVIKILDFFAQKYSQDPVFAKRVDTAVLRILTLKYRLYPTFDTGDVIPPEYPLSSLGQSGNVTAEVAAGAATLVSPDAVDLATLLPSPPGPHDHIVFLTDTRTSLQCSGCSPQPMLAVDALQNAVLRLYGSQAGGQITSVHLISYPLDGLANLLQGGQGNSAEENDLNQAQWIIFSLLDAEPNASQTVTFERFLTERQDLLKDKHVILFSFSAPYYLDPTDISKLTAFYCLYGKSAAFVDVAARLLFQELTPAGALPVSVPGTGYDLFTATLPDPSQIIQLSLDVSPVVSATPGAGNTPQPTVTPTASFKVGEPISVRTGVILDLNHHPVPDGTPVTFTLSSSAQGTLQSQYAVTTQGVARASFSTGQPGLFQVQATSDPATTSVVLQLVVSTLGYSVTVISPTQSAGLTPTPRLVATSNPVEPITVQPSTGFGGWLIAMVLLAALAFLAFWLGKRLLSAHWGLRWALCTVLGGLLSYNYLALGLPGAGALIGSNRLFGSAGMVLAGAALGLVAGFAWERIVSARKRQSS